MSTLVSFPKQFPLKSPRPGAPFFLSLFPAVSGFCLDTEKHLTCFIPTIPSNRHSCSHVLPHSHGSLPATRKLPSHPRPPFATLIHPLQMWKQQRCLPLPSTRSSSQFLADSELCLRFLGPVFKAPAALSAQLARPRVCQSLQPFLPIPPFEEPCGCHHPQETLFVHQDQLYRVTGILAKQAKACLS